MVGRLWSWLRWRWLLRGRRFVPAIRTTDNINSLTANGVPMRVLREADGMREWGP